MSVIELPRLEPDARPGAPERGRHPPATAREEPPELNDATFAHLFKQGALYGTPALYAILVGTCWLAAPGHPGLLLAALWPAVVAGWYFGGIVALTIYELRHEPAHRRRPATPAAPASGPLPLTRPPAVVH